MPGSKFRTRLGPSERRAPRRTAVGLFIEDGKVRVGSSDPLVGAPPCRLRLRLNRTYRRGDDERGFLTFLDGVLANGTPAEQLLEAYHGRWAGKVDPVFEEFSY